MNRLPLVISPDPLLKQVSKEVDKIDDELRSFMKDMVHTMYNEHGVGLAAVQVGKLIRVLVIDVNYEIDYDDVNSKQDDLVKVKNANARYFINPKIIEFSANKSSFNEGCLSFPGARSMVDRPEKIKVQYLDFDGNKRQEEMSGLLATCFQHEMDHLNGVTFVDHISKIRRDMILKKMKKLKR